MCSYVCRLGARGERFWRTPTRGPNDPQLN